MPDRDRLRALQMRVARHRRLGFLLGAREHVACQPAQRAIGFEACILDIEPQRRSHLVVARAAGMDLPPDVAEQALDHGVDVLVVRETVRRGHRREDPLRLLELSAVEQAGGMQAPGMEPRAFEVVRQQFGVVRQEVRPDLGRHPFTDPARPESHVVSAVTRLRAAASSVSSEARRTKPSAASCGNVSPGAYEASVSA